MSACEGQAEPPRAPPTAGPLANTTCTYTASPRVGSFTADFTPVTSCVCSMDAPSCHAIWRARVVAISPEGEVTLEIEKADGSAVQVDALAEVRRAGEGLNCTNLAQATPLVEGALVASSSRTQLRVQPFSTPPSAPEERVALVAISAGSDDETEMTWWQQEPVWITRTCAP
jgi:hypothetical protein